MNQLQCCQPVFLAFSHLGRSAKKYFRNHNHNEQPAVITLLRLPDLALSAMPAQMSTVYGEIFAGILFCKIMKKLAPQDFYSFNFHEYLDCLVLRPVTEAFLFLRMQTNLRNTRKFQGMIWTGREYAAIQCSPNTATRTLAQRNQWLPGCKQNTTHKKGMHNYQSYSTYSATHFQGSSSGVPFLVSEVVNRFL